MYWLNFLAMINILYEMIKILHKKMFGGYG